MSNFLLLYTLLHVLISLVGIGSGFVVMYEMLLAQASRRWTVLFLTTTTLTSLTGFGFPFTQVTPGHVLGVLSLIALGLAFHALVSRRLFGKWRAVYVVAAFAAQYFNVFVLIVQSFQKVPALRALAPTQTEAPFVTVQFVTLAVFLAWGTFATLRFLPAARH